MCISLVSEENESRNQKLIIKRESEERNWLEKKKWDKKKLIDN